MNARAYTLPLGAYGSQLLCLKFKPIHCNAPIFYGLSKLSENQGANSVQEIICSCYSQQTLIQQLSPFHLGLNTLPESEIACEVIIASRTIRFLFNGKQLHDGVISISLSHDELQRTTFFVRLCGLGDCVRIID